MEKRKKTARKLVITDAMCTSIERLISSSDEGDRVMALQCIENCELSRSLGALLYLYKISPDPSIFWKEHAGDALCKVISAGIDPTGVISYKDIILRLRSIPGVSKTQMNLVCNRYISWLMRDISRVIPKSNHGFFNVRITITNTQKKKDKKDDPKNVKGGPALQCG